MTPADSITVTLATPSARAAHHALDRAMRALDTMPTSTTQERTAHADAVERFLGLADAYDVLVYGPVVR